MAAKFVPDRAQSVDANLYLSGISLCATGNHQALTPACAGFFVLLGSVLIELHPPPSHGHGVGVHCGLFHQRPPVTPL